MRTVYWWTKRTPLSLYVRSSMAQSGIFYQPRVRAKTRATVVGGE